MKKFILVSVLLLTACGAKKSSSPQEDPVEAAAKEDVINSVSVKRQILLIDGVSVVVTRAAVDTKNLGEMSLYLVKTPTQTLNFAMGIDSASFMENLPARYLELLQGDEVQEAAPIDLMIDKMKQYYAVLNVLSLDRCRSVSIVPQIVDVLKAPRTILYLGVNIRDYKTPNLALRWDLQKKQFIGFVPTDNFFKATADDLGGEALFLTPNKNVRNPKLDVYLDSAFLEASDFNMSCNSKYNLLEKSKPIEQFEPSDRYLPRYDSKFDELRSSFIADEFTSVDQAFGSSRPIYPTSPKPLHDDLVSYAKSHPLFKKFYQGQ